MQKMIRRLAIVAIAALWPAIATAADQEAAQRIASALRTSGQFVDYSIGIKFDNGTAWLLGRVANDEQRQLAISLVEQMDGVTKVVDKLEVKSSRPSAGNSGDTGVRFAASQTASCPTNCKPQRTPPSTLAAQSYNDPGDPLQSRGAQLAPSNSRRFAPEPNYRVSGGPQAARMPMDGQVRQVSQETDLGGAPNPMSYGYQRPGSYRLAGPAPVNTQAMPAGYNVSRTAGPMYGPTMGGGCPGGACAGGNCAVPPYEQPHMPCYSWPSYAAYPNYAAVTYPRQYSPTAWPYIGPFYPYPQVPLGWRKVSLEWDDGWWWLDFYDNHHHH
jgi:hypothetical protein